MAPPKVAKIIQFPGKRPTEATQESVRPSSPQSIPPSSLPDSDPISSSEPRPSFHGFTDFTNIGDALTKLETTVAGQQSRPPQSLTGGNYTRIKLGLEILANPTANGGYDAHFVRANEVYDFYQEMPGDPIRIQHFKLNSNPSLKSNRTLDFQLTYYPNGEIGYAVRFDQDGKAVSETKIKEGALRRGALGAHEETLIFINRQQTRLADGRNAFTRMEAPLKQLQPSELDHANRAAWYNDFVVMDGTGSYSLRTQNFGFGGLKEYEGQNSITIFENQGSRMVELFRISKTGEINYLGEGSPRRPPTPQQFALINRLSHQLEQAQSNPESYQTRLHQRLGTLEKSLLVKFDRPTIARTAMKLSPSPAAQTTLGEPMVTITDGEDLWRLIRLSSWGWQWKDAKSLQKPPTPSLEEPLPFREKFRWARIKEASTQMARKAFLEIPTRALRYTIVTAPTRAFNFAVELPGLITATPNKELPRKMFGPFLPHSWRWENPENPGDIRYLRPKGQIRWAMFKEYMRWGGKSIWHRTINHVTNLKPNPGELKLHILPDGSTDLEIYRNYDAYASDGARKEERGIYNIIRRNADKSSVDLGRIVKQIAKEKPDILKLNRAWQLKLAAQTLTGSSALPRSLDFQAIPEIPIHQLMIDGRGPKTATEAWEAIQQLSELKDLNAHWSSESEGLIPRETHYEVTFPTSQPPTSMVIGEEKHSTGKRVVINLWQGDNSAMAVYDDGLFNHPESARLNKAAYEKSRMGTLQKRWHHYTWSAVKQLRTYFEIQTSSFLSGYFASLLGASAYERLFWNQEQRDKIGTPLPRDWQTLKHELGAAFFMAAPATTAALTVDGFFNYGGGLINSLADKYQKGITWREAYAYNSPRLMNPPPAKFRPIPEPSFRFASIHQPGHPLLTAGRSLRWGMPYVRSLLQRGIPLFVGLLAVEGYHTSGKDQGFLRIAWNLLRGKLPPGFSWHHIANNFYHVGTVSLVSAGLTNLAARRTALAVARQGVGQSVRGLGGFLTRKKLLLETARGSTGTYGLTWKASLLVAGAEMVALGIWDSYERKQELVNQGKDFRGALSRAMDRYNRLLTRLQHGEEISPNKLQEAEGGVHLAHQHYQGYLKMMGKQDGDSNFKSIGLENDYGHVYRSMLLEDGAISQWQYRNKLQEMRQQEERTEAQIRGVYRSNGLHVDEPEPGVDLREFLVRTTQMLKENPQIFDQAIQAQEEIHSPIAISSPEARPVIEHLNWKIEKDPTFLKQTPQEQAQYLLGTFKGYRVTSSDGQSRPWTEGEAMAFLHDVQTENQHRLENLQEPLIKSSAKNQPSPETMQIIAEEEKKILGEAGKDNTHLGRLETELAENGVALDKQMENYFQRTSQKRDAALIQFLPEEPLAGNQTIPAEARAN